MFWLLNIIGFLLATFFLVPDMDGWAFRQLYGLFFLMFLISQKLGSRFHWSLGLFFLATTIPALVWGSPGALMMLLIFTLLLFGLNEKNIGWLVVALGVAGFGDSVLMIGRFLLSHENPGRHYLNTWWVTTNASLDASLLALTFPIVINLFENKYLKFLLAAVMIAAVFISRSNTSFVALIAMYLVWCVINRKKKLYFYAPLMVFLGASVWWMKHSEKFLTNEGRYAHWKMFSDFWRTGTCDRCNTTLTPMLNVPTHVAPIANHFVGSGLGTLAFYGINLQPEEKFKFMFAHNDFIQLIFEQGYLGLVALVILLFFMFKKAFTRPVLLATLVGYCVVASTLYPVHLFFFQLIGVALVYTCFVKETSNA